MYASAPHMRLQQIFFPSRPDLVMKTMILIVEYFLSIRLLNL
jgi:hypothetical protein